MSDLYYTEEEIDQLQKDMIDKYFNVDMCRSRERRNDDFYQYKNIEEEYIYRFGYIGFT